MSTEALNRSLGRIEGKQDLILSRIDQINRDHETLKETVDSLDNRVIKVERRMTYWAGAIAVIMGALYYFRDRITGLFD